jgi:hypothetical protein
VTIQETFYETIKIEKKIWHSAIIPLTVHEAAGLFKALWRRGAFDILFLALKVKNPKKTQI